MTNVTLSIEDSVYGKMKKHSEIKWSEFIRKAILARLKQMEAIESFSQDEGVLNMLASQEVLRKDWDNDLDERWDDV